LTGIKYACGRGATLEAMKTDRGSFCIGGHKQLLQEVVHDSYKPRRKIPSPARCPACLRIRDRLPAGA
jgi:hypothetical protein